MGVGGGLKKRVVVVKGGMYNRRVGVCGEKRGGDVWLVASVWLTWFVGRVPRPFVSSDKKEKENREERQKEKDRERELKRGENSRWEDGAGEAGTAERNGEREGGRGVQMKGKGRDERD